MKMDSRIKDRNHIFDCFNVDEAEKYIGKQCYMTNFLVDFWNLETILPRTLNEIIVKNDGRYVRYVCNCELYNYCLPVELVTSKTEKKYRPYTLEELQQIFTIGQLIKFRRKGTELEQLLIFNGYRYAQNYDQILTYIYLGPFTHTLDELFDKYEYEWQVSDSIVWKPFGVEE